MFNQSKALLGDLGGRAEEKSHSRPMRLELKYPVDKVWSSSKGGAAAWWTFWGTGIGEGGGGLRRSSQWNNMKENALQFSNLLKKMNIGNNLKKKTLKVLET